MTDPADLARDVLEGMQDLQQFRGRMSKVTVNDVQRLLGLLGVGALAESEARVKRLEDAVRAWLVADADYQQAMFGEPSSHDLSAVIVHWQMARDALRALDADGVAGEPAKRKAEPWTAVAYDEGDEVPD